MAGAESGRAITRRKLLKIAVPGIGYAVAGGMMNACLSFRSKRPLLGRLGAAKRARTIVIVGSGITGMCAGAILSKMGHRVMVLEAHPSLLGGHARSFKIRRIEVLRGASICLEFPSWKECRWIKNPQVPGLGRRQSVRNYGKVRI